MGNALLISSVFALAFYWVIGITTGEPYVSVAVSFFLLLAGGSTLARYARATYDVVVKGARNDDDDGHLAVYGTALLALGSVYGGVFNLLWVYLGSPMEWLGTPQSNFGRFLMASGFALLFRSPDEVKRRLLVPSMLWLAAAVAIAVTVAFLLGTQFAATVNPQPVAMFSHLGIDRPSCPDDRPVWGATGDMIYHTPDSPFRAMVTPSRCFADEREARAAGYRPPGE